MPFSDAAAESFDPFSWWQKIQNLKHWLLMTLDKHGDGQAFASTTASLSSLVVAALLWLL